MSGIEKNQLAGLNADELLQLKKAAEKEFESRLKSEVKELKKRAEFLATQLGVSVEEMLDLGKARKVPAARKAKKRGPKKHSKVAPKYRNPNDDKQTWTGRGIKPLWVREHLEKGGTMDSISI